MGSARTGVRPVGTATGKSQAFARDRRRAFGLRLAAAPPVAAARGHADGMAARDLMRDTNIRAIL
jgi:hypothetical protein